MLSVQVPRVVIEVYCDSHKNPAGRAKQCAVALVITGKPRARINHVEQIHRRSEVEYPSSVLLKALHLVHAHHCHKTCRVKRAGSRVQESVKRNLLSPIQVRDKPTKNEHDKHETVKGIQGTPRVWKVFRKCSYRLVFFEVFLLLVRQNPVQLFEPQDDFIIHPRECKTP